jgi:hypothetical protein
VSDVLWTGVLDRLLSGLAHDVNGRATALRGIALLAATDEPPETWLSLLEAEAARLEGLALGLSALRAEAPEPLDAQEVLQAAARSLASVHVQLAVEAPEGADVGIRASQGLLVRCVVALALELAPVHVICTVRARARRFEGWVALELWSDRETSPRELPAPLAAARLERLPSGYRLSLPALDGDPLTP